MKYALAIKKYVTSAPLLLAFFSCAIALFFVLFPIPHTKQIQHITKILPTKMPMQHPTPTMKEDTQEQQIIQSAPTSIPTTSQTTTTTSTTTTTADTATSTVVLQLHEPDGNFSYSITLQHGADVCGVLQEAKNEGKLRSLTLDNAYQQSMHSMYVKEINGYNNNWTFTAAGKAPLGCSLYTPKPGDTISWNYN
jgi:hypothetical protein